MKEADIKRLLVAVGEMPEFAKAALCSDARVLVGDLPDLLRGAAERLTDEGILEYITEDGAVYWVRHITKGLDDADCTAVIGEVLDNCEHRDNVLLGVCRDKTDTIEAFDTSNADQDELNEYLSMQKRPVRVVGVEELGKLLSAVEALQETCQNVQMEQQYSELADYLRDCVQV